MIMNVTLKLSHPPTVQGTSTPSFSPLAAIFKVHGDSLELSKFIGLCKPNTTVVRCFYCEPFWKVPTRVSEQFVAASENAVVHIPHSFYLRRNIQAVAVL